MTLEMCNGASRSIMPNCVLTLPVTSLVFLDEVHPSDNHPVALRFKLADASAFAPLCVHHAVDFTFGAEIVAGDDHNLVTLSNLHNCYL